MPGLMWLFLIPLIASAIINFLPFFSGIRSKQFAIAASLFILFMLLLGGKNWIGSEVKYAWMPPLGVEFYLAIDGVSFLFLCLVCLIIPLIFLAVRSEDIPYPRLFFGLVLLLQGILIGFFTARDLALFTFFWEAMLIPLYCLMTFWGGPQRQEAAMKFLVYMIAGGALMVAAVLALYLSSGITNGEGTFNFETLAQIAMGAPYAGVIFGVFLLAFAVKTPLFPFHAWLPDAYVQASTSGTILLSALLSKAGIYGVIRIGWGLFPELLQEWSPFLLSLAIAGVLYGGMAAWMQQDYKRLLAYSSLSHVNFILAGLFVWNPIAHSGAILQEINHGLIITALFLAAGWLTERIGTTTIGNYHGLGKYMPKLCWTTLFFVLASVALPGTNSFVGELLILFGVFQATHWAAVFLALTVILSAIYMLRWMQKTYFEEASERQPSWIDLRKIEGLVALPLVILILWIGIYPTPLLKLTHTQKSIETKKV